MPMVGIYGLIAMLLNYGQTLSQQAATVFTPRLQQTVSRGDLASVRYLLPRVTQMSMGLGVLVMVIAMFLGPEFLGLFYGPHVGLPAAAGIMLVLAVAYLVEAGNGPCISVMLGSGKVDLVAILTLTQAGANVGLTLLFVLVYDMGLLGVALGTAMPKIVLSGILPLLITSRIIEIPFGTFANRTILRWLPTAMIFALATFAITLLPLGDGWGWFFARCTIALLVYIPIFLFILCPVDLRQKLPIFRSFARQNSTETKRDSE